MASTAVSTTRLLLMACVAAAVCAAASAAPGRTARATQGRAQRPASGPGRSARQAHTAPRSTAPAPPPVERVVDPASDAADVSITGSVTASELRFDAVPNPTVEFPGRPERKTVWEAERTNLPRPAEPYVTYRDVGVRLKITSVFADIDRIVAEALGEVPTSEDAPAPETPQPSGPESAPAAPPQTAAPAVPPRAERPAAGSPR